MSLTPRSVTLLFAAAVSALFVPTAVAIVLAGAVVVASIIDSLAVRTTPLIERSAPTMLSRGIPGRISIRALEGWGKLELKQPVGGPGLEIEPTVAYGGLEASIVARRRGNHLLPAPASRSVGPLGLGCWYHRPGEDTSITVYPDLPAARRLALDVRLGRFHEEGRRSRGPLGLGTDLESIRDYQPDDDIRQVNWRATARVGSPMSNTYRIEQDRDVLAVVDCGRLMAAPTHDGQGHPITRLDAAVDAIAAIAAVAKELGDHIGVVAFADRVLRSVPPRRDNDSAVLHAIHDLEPLLVDSDYEAAFQGAAGRKGAFVLVLTDLLDESAARPMIEAMPLLGRRHSVTVASARDDAVYEALTRPAHDLPDLAAASVAAELTEIRAGVESQLRRHGADVIVAPAASLPRRVVASYVQAKRLTRF